MLGQAGKLGIRTGSGQNLGIARGYRAPALALEDLGDKCRSAARGAGANELVYEINEIIREPDSYLLAHPIMVPEW